MSIFELQHPFSNVAVRPKVAAVIDVHDAVDLGVKHPSTALVLGMSTDVHKFNEKLLIVQLESLFRQNVLFDGAP